MSDKPSNRGFYDFNLDIKLETEIDLYSQDREIYWKGKFEEESGELPKIRYEQAERFAKAIFTNTETLTSVLEIDEDLSSLNYELAKVINYPKLTKAKYDEIAKSETSFEEKFKSISDLINLAPLDIQDEDSPLKLVWERFCIDLSWEAIGKVREGADRILKLYSLVMMSQPSRATLTFLSRLSRCYIWGFDPECVMLCRSVLDTAFRDAIPNVNCEKHLSPRPRKYKFTLSDRIQAAFKEGVIDKKVRELANVVKERGNKAVHDQPNITKEVWETICDTLMVLEKIHGHN